MKDTPSDPLEGQVIGRRTARIQRRKGEGAQSVVYIAEPYLAMIYRNWCLRGDKDPGILIHGVPYVRGQPISDEALLRKVEAAAEDVEDTLLQNLSWPEKKDYARKNFGIDYRGEAVAIKMLKPSLSRNRELQERFGREVWIMKELQHPNIVGFIDYGTHDLQNQELYYVILEYVKDARRWRSLVPLEPRPVVKVCVRILRGLAYAHGKGVVHRDLKPGNVLADFSTLAGEDPDIRITDFGLATVTNPAFRDELGEDYKELTKSVETLGTPAYMSPEHVRNPKLVREYSDVFSASSLFYNLFTGRPPFEGSILEISDRIRYHRLPPRGALPKLLWEGLERGWREDPDKRPTAAEFLEFWEDVEKKRLYEGAKIQRFDGAEKDALRGISTVIKRLKECREREDIDRHCTYALSRLPDLRPGSAERIEALRSVIEAYTGIGEDTKIGLLEKDLAMEESVRKQRADEESRAYATKISSVRKAFLYVGVGVLAVAALAGTYAAVRYVGARSDYNTAKDLAEKGKYEEARGILDGLDHGAFNREKEALLQKVDREEFEAYRDRAFRALQEGDFKGAREILAAKEFGGFKDGKDKALLEIDEGESDFFYRKARKHIEESKNSFEPDVEISAALEAYTRARQLDRDPEEKQSEKTKDIDEQLAQFKKSFDIYKTLVVPELEKCDKEFKLWEEGLKEGKFPGKNALAAFEKDLSTAIDMMTSKDPAEPARVPDYVVGRERHEKNLSRLLAAVQDVKKMRHDAAALQYEAAMSRQSDIEKSLAGDGLSKDYAVLSSGLKKSLAEVEALKSNIDTEAADVNPEDIKAGELARKIVETQCMVVDKVYRDVVEGSGRLDPTNPKQLGEFKHLVEGAKRMVALIDGKLVDLAVYDFAEVDKKLLDAELDARYYQNLLAGTGSEKPAERLKAVGNLLDYHFKRRDLERAAPFLQAVPEEQRTERMKSYALYLKALSDKDEARAKELERGLSQQPAPPPAPQPPRQPEN